MAIDSQFREEGERERRILGNELYGLRQNRSKLTAESH